MNQPSFFSRSPPPSPSPAARNTRRSRRNVRALCRTTSGSVCSKAAEKAITNALRRDRREPLAALGEYVPAAATAAQQLPHDPEDNSARRDSNFALGRKTRGDYHETFSMAHVYYGVTALARFDARRCVLWFEDPLNTETVRFGGRSFPLAAYFSVPLAVMLASVNVDAMKLTRIPNSVDTL